jgi:hypothetical protein
MAKKEQLLYQTREVIIPVKGVSQAFALYSELQLVLPSSTVWIKLYLRSLAEQDTIHVDKVPQVSVLVTEDDYRQGKYKALARFEQADSVHKDIAVFLFSIMPQEITHVLQNMVSDFSELSYA